MQSLYHQTSVKIISYKRLFQLCSGNKERPNSCFGKRVPGVSCRETKQWRERLVGRAAQSSCLPGAYLHRQQLGAPCSIWALHREAPKRVGRHWAASRHVAYDLTFICAWNRGVTPWNLKNEGSFKMHDFSKFRIINAYCYVENIENSSHLLLQCAFLFIIEKKDILLTYCKCTQNQRVHSDIKKCM